MLECKSDSYHLPTSIGYYNVKIGNDSFEVKGAKTNINNYLKESTIVEISIPQQSYWSFGTYYYNWSIVGVDSSLFIDSNVSSGNTKTSHTIKFKMPGKKVTINLWK